MGEEQKNEVTEYEQLEGILRECYDNAEIESKKDNMDELVYYIGEDSKTIIELANTKHAARGAALTLAIYKVLHPEQDIRNHKAEYENGFSARGIDTKVTVPFLEKHGLPYNVESHWLSQTLSFAGPFTPDLELKTVPKKAGPALVSTVNMIQNADSEERIRMIIVLILEKMIEERNKGDIPLTKPKNLSIDKIIELLFAHFNTHYQKNAPRLPQIAIYSMYMCLKDEIKRYEHFELLPLERMKTANRKSGTIGDIDLKYDNRPIEAAEIKYEISINKAHVTEAMQKVKSESVERYFILSTAGIDRNDIDEINKLKINFLKSNGCEIIVDGIYETLAHMLRMLKTTNDFINIYTDLLNSDPDINYEHKVAWNAICSEYL